MPPTYPFHAPNTFVTLCIHNPFAWKDLTESTIDCSSDLYFKPSTSIERLLLYLYRPLSGVPSG
jgi:hypothetical protein